MNLKKLAKNKVNKKPHWNIKSQIIGECAELIVALKNYERDAKDNNFDDILEEMSDLVFCISAFMFKYVVNPKVLFRLALKKTKDRFPEELKK